MLLFFIGALTSVALMLVCARLLAGPTITRLARFTLAVVPGFHGKVRRVRLSLLPPRVSIERVELLPETPKTLEPFLAVPQIDMSLSLRDLMRARIIARTTIHSPHVLLMTAVEGLSRSVPSDLPPIAKLLSRAAPLRLDRIEVRHGQLDFLGATEEARLTVSEVELTIDNVATREALAQNAPAALMLRARVGRSGVLSVMVNAEPLALAPTFSGQAEITGLSLQELTPILEGRFDVAPHGTFECFITFSANDGQVSGTIKPILRDLSIVAPGGGAIDHMKAKLADGAMTLLAHRDSAHDTVTTIIPIRGTVNALQVELWPTVLALVRNAFFEGIRGGFANLPPARSAAPEANEPLILTPATPRPRPEKRRS